ncbi:MAG: cation transporter [Bryobacterales bacterium]|nr:cation transporter [Bryobacterales bacterium]
MPTQQQRLEAEAKRTAQLESGRKVASLSVLASVGLSAANLGVGAWAGSTSVVAVGAEFLGDILASGAVYLGMRAASRPPDHNHPYGHGRVEILAGQWVGFVLLLGGVGICYRSLLDVDESHPPPQLFAVVPLLLAIVVRGVMSTMKFRVGRRIRSASLVADAWNDAVDILSSVAALTALGLTLHDPARFLAADHYGGFAVGLVVIFTGVRVVREASLELMDTMPDDKLIDQARRVALEVDGVSGVEKCYARRTGLQFHVDIHIEVDPQMTVQHSHDVAAAVRTRLREELDWVADVLVHVEPDPNAA